GVALDKTERVDAGHVLDVYACDVEAGEVVAHPGTAGTTERVEQLRPAHRTPPDTGAVHGCADGSATATGRISAACEIVPGHDGAACRAGDTGGVVSVA